MDRLPLLGRALGRSLGLALVDGLDAAVRYGPGGPGGGLSAALLELVAVGLAAGSAAIRHSRPPVRRS
ncbi:hypothetical protein [Kitasatospora sp. NPDC056273]|uniref:hypothetical protein n=1 Tax=Kitasatospora sp. NPDC056273 TaxID=3345769 RepID=UPI0035E37966